MRANLIENLASKFPLTKEELLQKSIKAFLLDQLHLFEVERRKILAHHDFQTLEELDQWLIDNPDKKSKLLESFQRADYLTHPIDEISHWTKSLNETET